MEERITERRAFSGSGLILALFLRRQRHLVSMQMGGSVEGANVCPFCGQVLRWLLASG
jgi:hypothetical protein